MKVEPELKKICDGILALAALVQSRQVSDGDDAELFVLATAARENHKNSSDIIDVLNDLLDILVRKDMEATSSSARGQMPPLIVSPRDGGE